MEGRRSLGVGGRFGSHHYPPIFFCIWVAQSVRLCLAFPGPTQGVDPPLLDRGIPKDDSVSPPVFGISIEQHSFHRRESAAHTSNCRFQHPGARRPVALLMMSAATWPERGGWAGTGRDGVTFPPGRPLPCVHLLTMTLVPISTVHGEIERERGESSGRGGKP